MSVLFSMREKMLSQGTICPKQHFRVQQRKVFVKNSRCMKEVSFQLNHVIHSATTASQKICMQRVVDKIYFGQKP